MPATSQYTPQQRREAVAAYVATGQYTKASVQTGIPRETISAWRRREPQWWEQQVAEIRELYEEEHRAGLRQVVVKGIEESLERLENGDEKLDTKTGQLRRVKVTGKDAMTIAAIAIDKIRVSLGQPTSIQAKAQESTGDKLAALKELAKQQGIENGSIAELSSEQQPEDKSKAA